MALLYLPSLFLFFFPLSFCVFRLRVVAVVTLQTGCHQHAGNEKRDC